MGYLALTSTCPYLFQVGTSFSAFRYQASGCARAPQACLAGQIRDLVEEDQRRVAEGKPPRSSITRYTYGSESLVGGSDCSWGSAQLGLPPASPCFK